MGHFTDRHRRDNRQWAKHKALRKPEAPEHTSGTELLFSHDEVKVKGHSTQRDVEAGRTSHLCKRETTLQTPSPKKEQTHTSLLFEVANTFATCASLARQAARWAAEAHVLLRFRG